MRRALRNLAVAAVATGLLIGPGAIAPTSASGATAPAEEHCVVRVTKPDASGRLHLTRLECAPSRAEALRSAQVTSMADWSIGIHYDGPGLTGSSLTVVGADCTGGWLNLPAGWSNRISSTMHGCPRIRHFDGFWLVSPAETTLSPGGNLIALNNRPSSIQYLP
jgi:hypothetical protein